MKIIVNGDEKSYDKELTIKELLVVEKVKMPDYVSVQLNDEPVDGDEFENTIVKNGDSVDFLYFMGGGR